MATITHAKTVTIADPTQAELDAQIALGNYPPGTLLAHIALASDFNAAHTFALGANENFVTNAEKTVIGNTSGTNTGDNATNSQYSGLAASKEPTITGTSSVDFWSGAKTFINFATTVRATVLTGLSLATSQVIAATDTVLLALGYLQAQITALTATVAGKVASVTAGTNVTVTGTTTAPVVNAPTMTATVAGVVPTPPNDSTKFLNGVGAFAVPIATASNFPLVKNSTGVGETLTITAGFQFIVSRRFENRGDVVNRGDFVLL